MTATQIDTTARAYFARFGWDVTYSEYCGNKRNAELTAEKLGRPERWTGEHAVESECLAGVTAQLKACVEAMARSLSEMGEAA